MQPTRDEICGQLDRILASEPFVNADRLSRFLRYVVERTLAGDGDKLKEYVIGTEVFERGEHYDPRLDAIVRVEAGRLRAKLEEYYNGRGREDPLLIRMPRGGYAPVFEPRAAVATPRRRVIPIAGAIAALLFVAIAAWGARFWASSDRGTSRVTVAVLPCASYSSSDAPARLAARVTDGVTSELARLGTLGVVSHTSAVQFAGSRRPLSEVARSLNADVVMESSLENDGDRVRVTARLVDASTDRKFWVEDFSATVSTLEDLERRIAAAAADAITRRDR